MSLRGHQATRQSSYPATAAALAAVGGVVLAAALYWRYVKGNNTKECPEQVLPSATQRAASAADSGVSAPPVVPAVEIQDTPERRQAIQLYHALKGQANAAFQKGFLEDALQHYQDSVDVLAAVPVDVADAEIVQLSQVVRANVVLVFLKMERYEDARMLATFLLQDDVRPPLPLMCKVLFRRATAMVKLGDLDGAIADLQAAQHFSAAPDAMINDELARVLKLKQTGL
jgi:tetratricopeptide (TPR) repeat protein